MQEKRQRNEAFIEDKWPDAVVTDTGLRYIVMKEGTGNKKPSRGKDVTVHYTGTFLNGQKFDSSYDREGPTTFQVGRVIEGWNQALLDMKRGEKRLLIVPPELGYGERGYPGVIPPSSFLLFEVELMSFE